MPFQALGIEKAPFTRAQTAAVTTAPGTDDPGVVIADDFDPIFARSVARGVDREEPDGEELVLHTNSVACYTTLVQAKTLGEIERELRQLAVDERLRWQHMALLLMHVEKEELWRERASSFTRWLKELAGTHSQARLYWRHLTAARFYESLRKEDRSLPPLGEAEATPAPLELARKMRRVMPADAVEPLVRRVARGQAGRPELERVWVEYSPAIAGKSSRGRGAGVQPTDVDVDLLERGRFLDAIRTSAFGWPKVMPADLKIHLEVLLAGEKVPVLALRQEAGVELHALELWPTKELLWRRTAAVKRLAKVAQPLWVIAGEDLVDEAAAAVPKFVGLVGASAEQLRVVRSASVRDADAATTLTMAVLRRLHRWEPERPANG